MQGERDVPFYGYLWESVCVGECLLHGRKGAVLCMCQFVHFFKHIHHHICHNRVRMTEE